ncbi:MAG: LuxR C-terminal-related transcriptional regulator [Ramlibacter sp.]
MQLLVTGADAWAVQGLAQALRRAGQASGLEVEPITVDALAASAPADVLLVVQASPETAQRIRARVPARLPVLWLGGAPLAVAQDARPTGVLAAQADDTRILAAAQALAAGLHVADTQDAVQALRASPAIDGAGEPLTPRELEVFELLAKGLANRDIALALGISSHTAKFHVAQILEKTGAATRTEAVRQGLRMGWIGL